VIDSDASHDALPELPDASQCCAQVALAAAAAEIERLARSESSDLPVESATHLAALGALAKHDDLSGHGLSTLYSWRRRRSVPHG
jgi:hypothetical protein